VWHSAHPTATPWSVAGTVSAETFRDKPFSKRAAPGVICACRPLRQSATIQGCMAAWQSRHSEAASLTGVSAEMAAEEKMQQPIRRLNEKTDTISNPFGFMPAPPLFTKCKAFSTAQS